MAATNALSPTLTRSGPSGRSLALGGAAALALATPLIVDPHLAINWLVGLAVGITLQRGRFCFAGAFRDLFLMKNGTVMRAILVGLAIATPMFALLQAKAVPNPSFGALPSGAHVVPAGLHLVVGGLLFGVGMVVAGGCVSGTLYRIGEGYLASWASLGGILLGLQLAAYSWNWWWTVEMQYAPNVWLPSALGYGGAVVASLAALAAAYVGVLWWENRDAGPPMPSFGAKSKPPAPGLAGQLAALRANVVVKGWPPLVAAAVLAGINIAAYTVDHPIGVTGELASWADRAASLVGFPAPTLLGADALQGCNLVLQKLGLINEFTMLDVGLVVGALVAALAAGEFKWRAPRQRRRYAQSLAGGTLMGYGAGIGIGCTLGAFFSAIPSLGLNGWIFGLALLAGAGLGTQVIRRIA